MTESLLNCVHELSGWPDAEVGRADDLLVLVRDHQMEEDGRRAAVLHEQSVEVVELLFAQILDVEVNLTRSHGALAVGRRIRN